jgi:hypothetical protein
MSDRNFDFSGVGWALIRRYYAPAGRQDNSVSSRIISEFEDGTVVRQLHPSVKSNLYSLTDLFDFAQRHPVIFWCAVILK